MAAISDYHHVLVELRHNAAGSLRLIPLPNQFFNQNLHVSASRNHRSYPLGTVFEVYAKEIEKYDGAHYLYVNHRDELVVID